MRDNGAALVFVDFAELPKIIQRRAKTTLETVLIHYRLDENDLHGQPCTWDTSMLKLVHVIDTHLRPEGELLLGMDPVARFQQVMHSVSRRHGDADHRLHHRFT